MRSVLMARGAAKLVRVCGRVQAGEEVVIVTDYAMDPAIPTALAEAAMVAGAAPYMVVMPQGALDSGEPGASVRAALMQADVIFTPVSISITHTEALKAAVGNGARAVVMSAFVPEMMMGGGIEADFEAIAPDVETVAGILDRGRRIELSSPGGTRLRLDVEGRQGIAKTCIAAPGDFTPVPDIEAAVSPLEGSAEGVIVADVSIPYLGIGRPDRPVTLHVEAGNVVRIEGGHAADKVRAAWAAMADPNVYNVAELGIGMNPHCRLTGNMLEDEGIAGAVHIGTGTSITLGGRVKAACHYDFLMSGATVLVDGEPLLEDGALRLPERGAAT